MSWKRGSAPLSSFKVLRRRSKWKTLSGGEFGWGGTSVKRLTRLRDLLLTCKSETDQSATQEMDSWVVPRLR